MWIIAIPHVRVRCPDSLLRYRVSRFENSRGIDACRQYLWRKLVELGFKDPTSFQIQLPGRTENEINNFWNTRMKRLQRSGKPIYPPVAQAVNNSSQNQNSDQQQEENRSDASVTNNFDIFHIDLKYMALN